MSSWPITNDVPVAEATGQCALCAEVFPFVNILSCRRLKGGDVPICLTCHQRFHPACTIAQSMLWPSHHECRVCGARRGVIVCALCCMQDSKDEVLDGVLMCQECSEDIHSPCKQHHSDHFYPVASPAVVAIKSPVQWHNFVDVRCEISSNQSVPRTQGVGQHSMMHQPCASSLANQQRDDIQRGGASNRSLQPQAEKQSKHRMVC